MKNRCRNFKKCHSELKKPLDKQLLQKVEKALDKLEKSLEKVEKGGNAKFKQLLEELENSLEIMEHADMTVLDVNNGFLLLRNDEEYGNGINKAGKGEIHE